MRKKGLNADSQLLESDENEFLSATRGVVFDARDQSMNRR